MSIDKTLLEQHKEVVDEAVKIHDDYPSLTLKEVTEKAQEVIEGRECGFRSENLESFF